MTTRVRALVAAVVLLGLTAGGATAKFITGGGPGPNAPTPFAGSDGAGRVTFLAWRIYFNGGPLYLTDFRFANRCSRAGTDVKARINVSRKNDRFDYRADGVTVIGSLNPGADPSYLTYGPTGTIRLRTRTCDSGVLRFAAKQVPAATAYRGTDRSGRVTFLGRHLDTFRGPIYLTDFHFANRCSKTGTDVRGPITVTRPDYRFRYRHHGIAISGTLHRANPHQTEGYISYGPATGKVRIRRRACDSGVLKFSTKQL